jgi:hypothetical protein
MASQEFRLWANENSGSPIETVDDGPSKNWPSSQNERCRFARNGALAFVFAAIGHDHAARLHVRLDEAVLHMMFSFVWLSGPLHILQCVPCWPFNSNCLLFSKIMVSSFIVVASCLFVLAPPVHGAINASAVPLSVSPSEFWWVFHSCTDLNFAIMELIW